jgi:thiosulfate/3-mercaptopyruvate sulfurtransferase
VPDVRLLDGGRAAWQRAGGPLETGEVEPEPGTVTLTGGGMPVLDADAAAALPRTGGVLLDARAGERYRGEVEPIDPRAGHVPGAVSAPTTENLAPDGTFLPVAVLSERFAALGARPGATVGVYCGSGVTAAHEVAALAAAGVEAALWPGSWSQWSADPTRPAATGPDPG